MRFRTGPGLLPAALAATAAVVAIAVVVGVTVVAAGGQSGTSRWAAPIAAPPSGPAASAGSAGSSPAGSPSPSPLASCPPNTGWDCAQQRRFAAANALLADSPGKLGVIVHDRNTNAVWRAGTTANTTWTASTIKLAIVATILEWHREGKISITDTDRANMSAALVDSSNAATTTLWARYGGQPMFHRFRSKYEMTSLSVVSGYELFWRNLRCNAEDLHHLMLYILNDLYLDDRAYLIGKLRGVGANQQWGVWAAGSALRPGNKNGWAQKPDSGSNRWVTHTVGFAGPSECYIVVITYSQPPSGTLSKGIHTVSDLAATIFAATVPARVVTP